MKLSNCFLIIILIIVGVFMVMTYSDNIKNIDGGVYTQSGSKQHGANKCGFHSVISMIAAPPRGELFHLAVSNLQVKIAAAEYTLDRKRSGSNNSRKLLSEMVSLRFLLQRLRDPKAGTKYDTLEPESNLCQILNDLGITYMPYTKQYVHIPERAKPKMTNYNKLLKILYTTPPLTSESEDDSEYVCPYTNIKCRRIHKYTTKGHSSTDFVMIKIDKKHSMRQRVFNVAEHIITNHSLGLEGVLLSLSWCQNSSWSGHVISAAPNEDGGWSIYDDEHGRRVVHSHSTLISAMVAYSQYYSNESVVHWNGFYFILKMHIPVGLLHVYCHRLCTIKRPHQDILSPFMHSLLHFDVLPQWKPRNKDALRRAIKVLRRDDWKMNDCIKRFLISLDSSQESYIEKLYNIEDWDVSGIRDMSGIFRGEMFFDQDISQWDTSNVTDMSNMFNGARSFNGDISGWNTTGVVTMRGMFANAHTFNADIGWWDTSSVTDMSYMFSDAKVFNADIGWWDTSNVTNMRDMFRGASAFNQDIRWWKISSVENMYGMFSYAKDFDQNISNWDTSKVTNITNMFFKAESMIPANMPKTSGVEHIILRDDKISQLDQI